MIDPTTYRDRRVAWLGEPLPETRISFEFFPPKTEPGRERLWDAIADLSHLRPGYVSVTCGAGGNPAVGTAPLVSELGERTGLLAVPHLTCASATRAEIDAVARNYWEAGSRRVVALRGDRQNGVPPGPDQYAYAADLVAALRAIAPFEIAVAAYPEPHPEATSAAADFDNLRRKIDAGANRAITQYCFETETVLRFRDRMVRAGLDVPLAIGILPVHDFTQVKRFSERCGAGIPAWLGELFDGLDPAQSALVGASVAAEQARRLIVEGISELHFYTLNRAELTVAACRLLGIRPKNLPAAA